ncbi:MAG: Ig-like domain-containing protein [Anaerolineae bacterium]|nr:Ig-like domain-containing protein [Anaerolineae bacterium]
MCRSIIFLFMMFTIAGCNLSQSSSITPIPTPDLPQVEILAPANNRQIFEGTEFDIDIVARDTNPGISRVELFIDSLSINDATPVENTIEQVFTVRMNWRAIGEGLHVIEVVAYRPDGTQSDTATINIDVLPRD